MGGAQMNDPQDIGQLLDTLTGALDLLAGYEGSALSADQIEPLPSLLDQCQQLLAQDAPAAEIRTLHHFACTGGTVISKCLSALPNTTLLSEVDPLSLMPTSAARTRFAPTDLVMHMRLNPRGIDEEAIIAVFLAALETLHDHLLARGQRLVLRDHAHSHFCTDRDPDSRASLHEIVARRFPTRGLVTLRNPIDSYLSLHKLGWHSYFTPSTPEEYARRYRLFLDRHRGMPQIRYEDFVTDPETVLPQMCRLLDLPWTPDALQLFPAIPVSGASGRQGDVLALRPRRPVSADLARQIEASPDFLALCGDLGYDATL